MSDRPAEPDVLTRARIAPLTPGGLDSAEGVRRRSDRRRRRQWVGGTAGAAVLAVTAGLPWVGDVVDRSLGQDLDPAGTGEQIDATTAGLGYALPDGWEVLSRPEERRTCVGPAGSDGCPAEVVVGDRTSGVTLRTQMDRPQAQCDDGWAHDTHRSTTLDMRMDFVTCEDIRRLEMVIVSNLDKTAWVTTTGSADPDIVAKLQSIVASFVVPADWPVTGPQRG